MSLSLVKKNIVLVTYTTTGNTKVVQERIVKQLRGANYSVTTFDAISIIRSYQLGRKKPENLSVEAVGGNLISDLQQSIMNSEVVGIGGFAFGLQTPPGLTDIFSEEYLPSNLFKNMKYYFTFGTAGQRIGTLHDILATLLSQKNSDSVYLGGLTVICPENFAPLQPQKGYRDMWGQEQIDKIQPFVESVIHVFDGSTPVKAAPFKKAYFKRGLMQKFMYLSCGKLSVNHEKCVKCGMCARNCPYGALTVRSDIEDGFPAWSEPKCEYCHMCFNHCPKEAINYGNCGTETKSRHSSPFLNPQTGAVISSDPEKKIVGIPLPTPNKLILRNVEMAKKPLIIIAAVIIALILLFILL